MITAIDKNTALVLIDLQKGIVGRLPAETLEPLKANAVKLATAFKNAGLPVVLVHVIPAQAKDLRKDQPMQLPAQLPQDFADLLPELQPLGSLTVLKHTWNAFYNTDLHDQLQSLGVTGIVLGGVSTAIGVEGTARAAFERNYNIAFAADAMADPNEGQHKNSLENIFPRMGEVGTTSDILEKLKSER